MLKDRCRDTGKSVLAELVAGHFLEERKIPLVLTENILHTANTERRSHTLRVSR